MPVSLIRLVWLCPVIWLFACAPDQQVGCDNAVFTDLPNSAYILPYQPGQSHRLIQGNCSSNERTHHAGGMLQFAYDFAMPMGTPVMAARAGRVRRVVNEFQDYSGIPGEENLIVITHDDGSFGFYVHLQQASDLVGVDDWVEQGDIIGYSGNSGYSSEPHLHFHVLALAAFNDTCDPRLRSCAVDCRDDGISCESIPVSFRNTGHIPLSEGAWYEAMDFAPSNSIDPRYIQ